MNTPADLRSESGVRLAYCETDGISGERYVLVFFGVLLKAADIRRLAEYLTECEQWVGGAA